MTRSISRGWTSRLALAVCVIASIGAGIVAPAPVAAASPPPWRFQQQVDGIAWVGSHGFSELVMTCDAGFTALSAGISDITWSSTQNVGEVRRAFEYRATDGTNYHIGVWNTGGAAATVRGKLWCVSASSVAQAVIVSDDFYASSYWGEGTVYCPVGMHAITGGADWNTVVDYRSVNYFGVTDGGNGWSAGGNGATPGNTLHIEVYCLPDADMQGAQMIWTYDNNHATCPAGFRVLTGGTSRSPSWISAPSTTEWIAAYPAGGTAGAVLVMCIPASQPTVTLTQVPPQFTSNSSGTFKFSAVDQVGEAMTYRCQIADSRTWIWSFVACSPNTPITLTMPEGPYVFMVTATNVSKRSDAKQTRWNVDKTAPTATTRSPLTAAPLTGAFVVDFSEPVTGIDKYSFQVMADGSPTPLAGTVTSSSIDAGAHTRGSWTPAQPLIPGQTYHVSLGSGITDRAGNSMWPSGWTVRAATGIDSQSVAIRETWDADTSPSAHGGGYIETPQAGARTTFTFTGTNVSVLGTCSPDGGLADVYLDGTKVGSASFYCPSWQWQVPLFTRTGLASARHTIDVRLLTTIPAGSSGQWARIDAFQVGSSVAEESSDAVRSYFARSSSTQAVGGSFSRVWYQTTGDTGAGPRYAMSFRGTGLRIVGTKGPNFGQARIFIDGTLRATVSLNAASTSYQAQLWTSPTLTDRVHNLRIDVVGTPTGAQSEVAIDALYVK